MLLTLGDGEIFNSSANDSNSQKNNNSGKSPRSTDSHSTTAGGGAALLPPFRVSLLSLLADFIDGSCNELRTELQTQMGVSDCSFSFLLVPLIIIFKLVFHSIIVTLLLSLT